MVDVIMLLLQLQLLHLMLLMPLPLVVKAPGSLQLARLKCLCPSSFSPSTDALNLPPR